MLARLRQLNREFVNLDTVLLREVEREVSEGQSHTGIASVVQFIARKKGLSVYFSCLMLSTFLANHFGIG